jgi:hypothetical protein
MYLCLLIYGCVMNEKVLLENHLGFVISKSFVHCYKPLHQNKVICYKTLDYNQTKTLF